MMDGGAVLQGRVHKKWSTSKQYIPKRLIFHVEHKGTGHLAADICNNTSQSGICCRLFKSLSSSENQLRSLDSYFQKLHNNGVQPSSSPLRKTSELFDTFKTKRELTSLEDYLGKLDGGNVLHVVLAKYFSFLLQGRTLLAIIKL